MKDLKHLIYFENLLEDANNELIRKAQAEGMLALGYTCYHMPEVLLNVDNCFSVRMRAPNTGSIDVASYYMSNYTWRVLPRAARASHRGRLQLPRRHLRRGRLRADEPLHGEHRASQVRGEAQLLRNARRHPLQVHGLHARPLRVCRCRTAC